MNIGFMSFAIICTMIMIAFIGYIAYENHKYKKQHKKWLKNHKYDK